MIFHLVRVCIAAFIEDGSILLNQCNPVAGRVKAVQISDAALFHAGCCKIRLHPQLIHGNFIHINIQYPENQDEGYQHHDHRGDENRFEYFLCHTAPPVRRLPYKIHLPAAVVS